MKTKYPVKKLLIFNFWITIYFSLFGFVSTLATNDLQTAISSSVIGAFIIILNVSTNLLLLLFFEKLNLNYEQSSKIKFLLSSYFLNFLLFIVLIFIINLFRNSILNFSSIIYIFIINFFINTLIITLQNYVVIHDLKAKWDVEKSQLRAANSDATNKLLRQQIHPHFLFNALNILKSLYKVSPKAGEQYLIRLSDFLRAAVSTNNIKIIPVKDEIKLCEDYLEMQQIRFGNALDFKINITDKTLETCQLPSFSIQPLIENAIKHNEITEETPLKIDISEKDNRIIVTNNLKPKSTTETSAGSGLINLNERYKLLIDDEIIITANNEEFSVSIKIIEHEDSNYRR